MRNKRIGITILAFASALASAGAPALAVTQEDVFRSINENMGQEPDYSRLIPWLLAMAALVVVVMVVRQRQKIAANPRALNHPGKLMREVVRFAEINPVELKKMKALADDLQIENPLTLMLCPSLTRSQDQIIQPPSEEPDHNIR